MNVIMGRFTASRNPPDAGLPAVNARGYRRTAAAPRNQALTAEDRRLHERHYGALNGNPSRAARGRFGQGARWQVSCGVSISGNGRADFEPQPGFGWVNWPSGP
jgi:hypothetical protein